MIAPRSDQRRVMRSLRSLAAGRLGTACGSTRDTLHPKPLALESLIQTERGLDQQHDECQRGADGTPEAHFQAKGKCEAVEEARNDEHYPERVQQVDRIVTDLQKAHQQQREGNVLGEVGLRSDNADNADFAVISEKHAAPPQIDHAGAQYYKPKR